MFRRSILLTPRWAIRICFETPAGVVCGASGYRKVS